MSFRSPRRMSWSVRGGALQISAAAAEIVAEMAALGAAGAGAGAGAAAAAGAAGLGIAAVAGGGSDGGGQPPLVVLNAADVDGGPLLEDIFGENPDPDADRVIVTLGEDEDAVDVEAVKDLDGNWSLPADFTDREGEYNVTYTALDDGGDEIETGDGRVLLDQTPPTITIDGPLAVDDVLNAAEQGEDLTLTGTTDAEDGQEVTVTLNGVTYTTTAEGGTWEITVPAADLAALPDGDTLGVTADVSDAAGNPAATALDFLDADFTAPTVAIDTVSGDDKLTKADEATGFDITGTTDAEDGQVVTVTFNGSTYTTAAAGGAWTVTVPAADFAGLDTGDTPQVTAAVSDAAGNPATAATRTLNVDLTGPTVAIDVIEGDDVVNIAEFEDRVQVSGTATGAEGQIVNLTLVGPGQDAFGGTTVVDGVWSVTFNAVGGLTDGAEYTFTANVTDAEGIPAPEVTRAFTTDFTAPSITIDTPISEDGVLSGVEQGEGLTITGSTPDQTGLAVTVHGQTYDGDDITYDGDDWTLVIPAADLAGLPDGTTIDVTADVSDAAGNPAPQATAGFDTDFTPPTIAIDTISGDDKLTRFDQTNGFDITGTTDAEDGQQVVVTFEGTDYFGLAAGGAWSVTVPAADLDGLETGDTPTASAVVKDAAGNPVAAAATRTVDVDLTGPTISVDAVTGDDVINIAESGSDVTISGTATGAEGQTVTVQVIVAGPSVVLTDTATVTGGAWSVTLPAATAAALPDGGGMNVWADVSDAEGTPAPRAVHPFTTDYSAPTVTIDTPISGDDVLNVIEQGQTLDISGTSTAEDGQIVTVTLNGETYTGSVDGGNWSVSVPPADLAVLADADTVSVTADVDDAAGNPAPQAGTTFDTDFTAPTLTITDLAGLTAGQELTAGALVDGTGTDLPALAVNGISDAIGQTVTVTIGALVETAVVQGDGTWVVNATPDDLRGELDGLSSFSVQAEVADPAGNTTDSSLNLDVNLNLPTIEITDPAEGPITLGLDQAEDGYQVSGTTTEVPQGAIVTVALDNGGPSGTGSVQADGTWTVIFSGKDISPLADQTGYTVTASVSNGDWPLDVEDSFAANTDFEPEISFVPFPNDGVIPVADLDPNDTSIDGTTRGVEDGQDVTVTIYDEDGALFYTGTTQVQIDGTWELFLPPATVEAFEAGQSYDVEADVSNASGRAAVTAEETAIMYEPAANLMVALSGSTTELTGLIYLDPRTELPDDNGYALGETLTFDPALFAYDDTSDGYTPPLFGLTNESQAATGEVVFGGFGVLNGFDPTDPLVYFRGFEPTQDVGVIQFDVESTEGGNYSAFAGTAGDDTIVANNVDAAIYGARGDDAIDVSGAGVNTLIFDVNAIMNGFDTVTGFSLDGALPDRIGFNALQNDSLRGAGTQFEMLATGDTVGADTGLIVFTTALADFDAATVEAAAESLAGLSDGDRLYFMASDGTDTQLSRLEIQAGEVSDIQDLALFSGLGDLSTASDVNFLGFDAYATT
ncbi:Ig-like domain-containing protein [Rhodovulum adriaticum]|uniref:Uncharacterized protein n=2 Tax=Rhodovulum adriaticum TaxID=35804 RepID=A0A4R2NYK2_RHOAD|nr:Ig-like domain-containing protein [Rhodovulum adriaticum]TCP27310.1 hypothetical protein EV656_101213 [Rhodovulum adriaticum]